VLRTAYTEAPVFAGQYLKSVRNLERDYGGKTVRARVLLRPSSMGAIPIAASWICHL